MSAMMNRCVETLGGYLDQVITNKNGAFNAKEVVTGFTIDVIGSTSFALNLKTNRDLNEKNPFVEHGTKLADFSNLRIIAFFFLPSKINKWLKNSIGMNEESFDFFVKLSREVIKQRKEGGTKVKRNDLVQLLIDSFVFEEDLHKSNDGKLTASADHGKLYFYYFLQTQKNITFLYLKIVELEPEVKSVQNGVKGSIKRTLTENEIIAQCIIFFIAGFGKLYLENKNNIAILLI